MKLWVSIALAALKKTLQEPRHELNEIDWKAALSPDNKSLAKHLSAFSNHPGGGFLVYGVASSGCVSGSVSQQVIQEVTTTLSNIARQNLEPQIILDHSVEEYGGFQLLFIFVPESDVKPVHLHGNIKETFVRVLGTSRQSSYRELGALMMNSKVHRWEDVRASSLLADLDLTSRIDIANMLEIAQRPAFSTTAEMVSWLASEKFAVKHPSGGGYITNLGAITAAHRLADFPNVSRKGVRVVVYDGFNKTKTIHEREGKKGYAVGFQNLLQYVMELLPTSEVIEKSFRQEKPVYPEIALREIIANALIHQDFSIDGTGPLIEIFDDRIEISNPGGLLPSKQIDRLLGTPPESRNQELARTFRLYKICEERGSGLIKAGHSAELFGLPPILFSQETNSFKVTLFSPRTFAQMSAKERLQACLQHATLQDLSDSAMTNKSLRERLKMPEKQRSMVSALIREALAKGLIKRADPESKSMKYAEYVPNWV